MIQPKRKILPIVLSAWLAACGGGGGTSDAASSATAAPSGAGATGSAGTGATGATGAGQETAPSPASPNPNSAPQPTTPSFQLDQTARFNRPGDVAVDGAGDLAVMDRGNLALRRVAANGDVTTLGRGYDAGARLTSAPGGTLLVLDAGSVYRLASDGARTLVKSYAASPGSYTPKRIAADGLNRTYVLLQYRNLYRIERINADNSVTQVYFVNSQGSVNDIASDAAGNLAVSVSALNGPSVNANGTGNSQSHIDYVPLSAQSGADLHDPGIVAWTVPDLYITNGSLTFDQAGKLYLAGANTASNASGSATAIFDMRLARLSQGVLTTLFTGFPNGDNSARVLPSGTVFNIGVTLKKGELIVSDPFDQAIYTFAEGKFTLVAGKPGEPGSSD